MPLFHINNPRCLFVHIPKTAGNSIRNVVFKGDHEKPWFGDDLPEEWKSLFSFAFVRNPFDRVVSAWKMFCEGTVDDAWQLPGGKPLGLSLEEVLRLGLDDDASFGHPLYNQIKPTPLTRLKNHIIPQTHPYHGLRHVEFIGRFERLQEDFAQVVERLNLPSTALPRSNWTNRGHYRDYFDDVTRELAEQFYEQDIAQLGYSF